MLLRLAMVMSFLSTLAVSLDIQIPNNDDMTDDSTSHGGTITGDDDDWLASYPETEAMFTDDEASSSRSSNFLMDGQQPEFDGSDLLDKLESLEGSHQPTNMEELSRQLEVLRRAYDEGKRLQGRDQRRRRRAASERTDSDSGDTDVERDDSIEIPQSIAHVPRSSSGAALRGTVRREGPRKDELVVGRKMDYLAAVLGSVKKGSAYEYSGE